MSILCQSVSKKTEINVSRSAAEKTQEECTVSGPNLEDYSSQYQFNLQQAWYDGAIYLPPHFDICLFAFN